MERWYHRYFIFVWGIYEHTVRAKAYGFIVFGKAFIGVLINNEVIGAVIDRLES